MGWVSRFDCGGDVTVAVAVNVKVKEMQQTLQTRSNTRGDTFPHACMHGMHSCMTEVNNPGCNRVDFEAASI